MLAPLIGDLLPLAVGLLVSPMPIVAAIALLLGAQGARSALAFAVSYASSTALVVLIAASVSKGAEASMGSAGTVIVHVVLGIVLAALFFWLARRSWKVRPLPGEQPRVPAWLDRVDAFGPVRAVGLGVLLGIVNLKNLPLLLSAGTDVGSAGLGWFPALLIAVLFAAVGSASTWVPAVVALRGQDSANRVLGGVKHTLIAHNDVMMAVLFAILGAVQLGKAVGLL